MTPHDSDTIVAVATPPGRGAIGIVRLSGGRAIGIASALFRPRGGRRVEDLQSHTVQLGEVHRNGETIDEGLLCVMRAPGSYTGEDTAEFNCHGSRFILDSLVRWCQELGARLAEPGEFTRRAFLSGKMDLAQAESVADLVNASHESAARAAIRQLRGGLSGKIGDIRKRLVDALAGLEAGIDFPEDTEGHDGRDGLRETLEAGLGECKALADSFKKGRAAADGYRIVIAGKPNAGKSSLFNRLLGVERAIVTPEAGTTRDLVEGELDISGLKVILQDTAGLDGWGSSAASAAAMARSREALKTADMTLYVADLSREWDSTDEGIVVEAGAGNGIVVFNKNDLPLILQKERTPEAIRGWKGINVSATTGDGIGILRKAIEDVCRPLVEELNGDEAVITTLRHYNSIKECIYAVERAHNETINGGFDEIIAMELRSALLSLVSITSADAGDEILDAIFAKFCIGK